MQRAETSCSSACGSATACAHLFCRLWPIARSSSSRFKGAPSTPSTEPASGSLRPSNTSCGCRRLTPMPQTAKLCCPTRCSQRMPASLRQRPSRCATMSLGHLSAAPCAPRLSSASSTAIPAASGSSKSASPCRLFSSQEASRLCPGASCQLLPRRPLPAVWWSATTTVPSGSSAP